MRTGPGQAPAPFAKEKRNRYGSARFWGSIALADVFREVDEEVRREQLLKLWQRHSRHVIGALAAIVVLVLAIVGWREWQERQRNERANAYLAAAAMAPGEAVEALEELGGRGGGYAVLARLRRAASLAELDRKAEALAAFDEIARDRNVPQPYRDLAVLLYAQNGLGQTDAADLVRRLEPLTATENPWRFTALELTALAELSAGNAAKARVLFLTIADDPGAPAGLRGRAAEIAGTLPAS